MAATLTVDAFKEAFKGAFGYLESDARNLADFINRLFQKTLVLQVPTDADGDFTMAAASLYRVQSNLTVVTAYFLCASTITADATNNTTLKLNKADGAGGAETIVASYLSNVAGGSVAAFTPKLLTNSATAADLNVNAGQILGVVGTKGGTGVAVPAGVMIVNVKDRA